MPCLLPTAAGGTPAPLLTTHCPLLTTPYPPPTARCLLLTTNCQPPAASRLLLTTNCLPPTAYCLLPAAYCKCHSLTRRTASMIDPSRYSMSAITSSWNSSGRGLPVSA